MNQVAQPVTRRVALALRRVIARHEDALGTGALVFAVSGGPDSMGMLLACRDIGIKLRSRVVVAHFSHGLRPTSDQRECRLVERAAKALGVRFVAGQDQVRAPEADARESRYRFLSAVASNLGTAVVLTAHTEDDQAETVLLKLTRGAGLRGAGAIRELSTRFAGNNEIVLLRPLLSMNRGDMEAVCREARISPARDASNRRLKYSRNRIRHRVLGELERINPKVRSLLARFADNASADDEFLRQLAAQSVSDREERSPDAVRWSKRTLRALPHPLLIRVLEDAWRHLVGDGATLGRRKLEQATRVVAVGGRVTLPRSGCFEIGPGDTATMGIIQRGQGPV